jgi:hypothetical protein
MEKPQKDPKSGEMLPTGARASRLKEDGVNWIDANYDYAKGPELQPTVFWFFLKYVSQNTSPQ